MRSKIDLKDVVLNGLNGCIVFIYVKFFVWQIMYIKTMQQFMQSLKETHQNIAEMKTFVFHQ